MGHVVYKIPLQLRIFLLLQQFKSRIRIDDQNKEHHYRKCYPQPQGRINGIAFFGKPYSEIINEVALFGKRLNRRPLLCIIKRNIVAIHHSIGLAIINGILKIGD